MSERFDFAGAHARLAALGLAIEGNDGGGERAARVLSERARRWARPVEAVEARRDAPLLLFRAAGQACGVDPQRVLEVLGRCVPTRLPRTRPWLEGVVHYRGRVIALIDLGPLTGLEGAARRETPLATAAAIVVEAGGRVFAMRADDVPAMGAQLGEAAEQLGPAPAGELPGSIRRTTSGAALVVDLEALADDPRVVVDDSPR